MNALVLAYVMGDIICALGGISAAFLIWFGQMPLITDLYGADKYRLAVFVLVLFFTSSAVELYEIKKTFSVTDVIARIILSIFFSFAILLSFYYLAPSFTYEIGILTLSLTAFGIFQYSWHANYRAIIRFPGFARRVLILGTGPLARQIGAIINTSNGNYVLAGYLNCSSEPVTVPGGAIVGNNNNLLETAIRQKAHEIVVSLSERRGVFPLESMLICKMRGIEVVEAPAFYEKMTGKLLLEYINPSWLIFSTGFRVTSILRMIKRFKDLVIALVGLLFSLPLLLLIAILIKMDSPGPVFFRQERVGERDVNFTLFKFRSMRQDAEKMTGAVWASENDPRVTRIGGLLRKSRLDEIPQLLNVLKGDMSLVGPRPERPEFTRDLKKIIPYYSERHYVKPGITGWAQVSYPYGASDEDSFEKLRYDMYYIKNWSLSFDLMILLETMKVMILGRGGR